MRKYNIGDKVKIKSDLIVNELYGGLDVVYEMKPYFGKVLTIKNFDGNDYLMEEHDNSFVWNDAMIECRVEDYVESLDFLLEYGVIENKEERNIKGAIVESGDIVCGRDIFRYILVNKELVLFEVYRNDDDDDWDYYL